MSKIQISRLDQLNDADAEKVTDVWFSAFKNDIFVKAVSAGDAAFLKRFLYSTLLASFKGGEVYVASYEDIAVAGVSAWYPPGRVLLDSPDQGEGGFHELFADFTPDFRKWWMEYFLPKYDAQTTRSLGEGVKLGSWHLQMIGVRPELQRRGIGSALIEHISKKATAENKHLCLELENEDNIKFYESCNFIVKGTPEDYKNPIHDFTAWVMSTEA